MDVYESKAFCSKNSSYLDSVVRVIASQYLIEFILASAAIIAVPGPSVMFTIARAVSWGKATAFVTVLGNALGMFALSVLVAFGVGPLLQGSKSLLLIVQVSGGCYLMYLGYEALKHRLSDAGEMVTVMESKPSVLRNLRQGFMVGFLNPKAIVFIAAIFPQFLDPHGATASIQLLIFGVIWCVLAIVGDGLWALIVGSSRDWFATSQQRLVILRISGGLVMVTLGLIILGQVITEFVST